MKNPATECSERSIESQAESEIEDRTSRPGNPEILAYDSREIRDKRFVDQQFAQPTTLVTSDDQIDVLFFNSFIAKGSDIRQIISANRVPKIGVPEHLKNLAPVERRLMANVIDKAEPVLADIPVIPGVIIGY